MTGQDRSSIHRSPQRVVRGGAAWAFTAVALALAAIAFGRMVPSEQRAQTLAVSVPAASTPAAAESPSPVPS